MPVSHVPPPHKWASPAAGSPTRLSSGSSGSAASAARRAPRHGAKHVRSSGRRISWAPPNAHVPVVHVKVPKKEERGDFWFQEFEASVTRAASVVLPPGRSVSMEIPSGMRLCGMYATAGAAASAGATELRASVGLLSLDDFVSGAGKNAATKAPFVVGSADIGAPLTRIKVNVPPGQYVLSNLCKSATVRIVGESRGVVSGLK